MKYFKTLLLSLVLILSGCTNNQQAKPEDKVATESNKEVQTIKEDTDNNDTKESANSENDNFDKEGYPKVVTGLDGNEVTLDKPLDKVIIQGSGSGGPFNIMMYLDKDNFLSKIAAMDDGVKINRNDFYKRLEEVMPEIEDVPRISDFMDNDFSYEAILNSDADGIIAPISYKTQIDSIKDKIDIPVFYIDYHSQDLDKHLQSTKLIADVTGLDKNLDELTDFYESRVRPIVEKKYAEEERPVV